MSVESIFSIVSTPVAVRLQYDDNKNCNNVISHLLFHFFLLTSQLHLTSNKTNAGNSLLTWKQKTEHTGRFRYWLPKDSPLVKFAFSNGSGESDQIHSLVHSRHSKRYLYLIEILHEKQVVELLLS